MMTPEERYSNDPEFAALVNMAYSFITKAQFTPTELREAVMLAAIKYEMNNPRSYILVEKADIGLMLPPRKRESAPPPAGRRWPEKNNHVY